MMAEVHRYIPDGPDRLWDLGTSRYFVAVERMNEALERAAAAIDATMDDVNAPRVSGAWIRRLKERI
jgi:hypothetical protein